MVLAFANSVVCRWQARGYARDASHVRSRFMATAPHQPCPSLVHLQRQRLLLPRNVARMACSEVAWPAMTERLRGAGPPPRPRIILSHITILDGGASLLATGGSGSPSPPLPRNVTSRPAASVSLGLQSESALPTCRRHLSVSCGPWCEKCKALRPIPEGPPWWGITRRPVRSAAEPLGTSSGHAPVHCPLPPTGQILQRPMRRIQSRLDTWWPQSHACHPAALSPRPRSPLARPTTTALSPRRTGDLPSAGGFCE